MNPDVDESVLNEMARLESAIRAINASLQPLWAAARKSPPVARVVIEAMRAMAELRLERDSLEERAGLARTG